jgi:IS30 family transposase
MRECKGKHLTLEDMIRIEKLIGEGYSDGDIGIKIGKDRTTTWRDIKQSGKPRDQFSGKDMREKVSEKKSSAISFSLNL